METLEELKKELIELQKDIESLTENQMTRKEIIKELSLINFKLQLIHNS